MTKSNIITWQENQCYFHFIGHGHLDWNLDEFHGGVYIRKMIPKYLGTTFILLIFLFAIDIRRKLFILEVIYSFLGKGIMLYLKNMSSNKIFCFFLLFKPDEIFIYPRNYSYSKLKRVDYVVSVATSGLSTIM